MDQTRRIRGQKTMWDVLYSTYATFLFSFSKYVIKFFETGTLDAKKLQLRRFQYEELKKATNNFSTDFLVGKGGFGNVYQGHFDVEGTLAIKKLHPTSCTSIEEFRNEVRLISQVKHKNLVGLVGFCEQAGSKGTKALVYEYVSNGSLLDYIMGIRGMSLTWRQRVNIAIGAAKGIGHLHEGIKPRPVDDHSHVTSQVKGTPGYLDPAYCSSFHLSQFTDVFSFGVILLQLISARPAVDSSRGRPNVHIIDWVRQSLERGRVEEILDANLLMEECNMEMMLKMGQIGLKCVVGEPKQRPTMTQVWQELEAALYCIDNFHPKEPSQNSLTLIEAFGQSRSAVNHLWMQEIPSQNSISLEEIGLEKFYLDMDFLSFRSASLRCFETESISIDIMMKESRGEDEDRSTKMDKNMIIQR